MLSTISIDEAPDGSSLRLSYHYAWVGQGLERVALPFDPAEVYAAQRAVARFEQRRLARAEAARLRELSRLEAQAADLHQRIETLRRGGGGPKKNAGIKPRRG